MGIPDHVTCLLLNLYAGQKAREFQKNIYFCFIDYAKASDCVDHDKLWKILKEMGISSSIRQMSGQVSRGSEAGLTKTFQTWPRGGFHIP